MPKVTNTFIKSKLNKDLDARLIPNGEYRDAVNVQVSTSESDSVGSLENVLGNKLISTFSGDDRDLCIGNCVDESNGIIYLFYTNYKDPSETERTYSVNANNYIYSYNVETNTASVLVQGAFLNFSKTNPIFGVNILENFLFWTDNRNQPRKINLSLANGSYYTTEDQISVAKYNPYKSIDLFQETGNNTGIVETTMKDVTSKFLPNGGSATVNGAVNNSADVIVDEIKGEILASNNQYSITGAEVFTVNNINGQITALNRTVVTFTSSTLKVTLNSAVTLADDVRLIFNANPYYDHTFAGDPNYLNDLFVRFSYRFRFEDGEYSIMAPFTQIAFIPNQDGYFIYFKEDGQPEQDDLANSYRSTIVSFMENKIDTVKLIIPRPDITGSLSGDLNISELEILIKESDGLTVKVLETIQIDSDYAYNAAGTGNLLYDYKSNKAIKTLPSSELIRVYDKVPVRAFSQEITGNRVIYANFQDKHTPPVSLDYNVAVTKKDNVDLHQGAATTQSGAQSGTTLTIATGATQTGTIVIGSIMSGTGIPADTIVTSVNNKSVPNITQIVVSKSVTSAVSLIFNAPYFDANTVSKSEYPTSSLKQNRNYQVGVVLSDRYGRQSSVILSEDANIDSTFIDFKNSTIYNPYNTSNEIDTTGNFINFNSDSWPGDSLKVLFNSPIGPTTPAANAEVQSTAVGSRDWPGIYNGDSTSVDYNPLGWYSYKIVVKQTQQDYYNVYLPGIMASYPESISTEPGSTSHVVLINDNINKVPRDLSEVGPDQKQFRSSVRLFGRVENVGALPFIQGAADRAGGSASGTVLTLATGASQTGSIIAGSVVGGNGVLAGTIVTSVNNTVPNITEIIVSKSVTNVSALTFETPNNIVSTNYGRQSTQYYPGQSSDTASIISTVRDMFDYNPISPPNPNNFPQFYDLDSNPLIARLSTNSKIGQISTTNYNSATGFVNADTTSATIVLKNIEGTPVAGMAVTGPNIPDDITVISFSILSVVLSESVTLKENDLLSFSQVEIPGIQFLSVYETEPTQSQLDIYWETSTSGTITGLNTLIENTTGAASTLSSWTPTDFKESLNYAPASGAEILATDFQVLNSQGAAIVLGTNKLRIVKVLDGNGTNFIQQTAYFQLIERASPNLGSYNIKIFQSFWNNIWYSPDANLRNFVFSLEATVGTFPNEVKSTFTRTADLINIQPSINSSVPATGNIFTNSTESSFITLKGVNGANNPANRTKNLVWSIAKQTNALGQTVNIFNLSQQVVFSTEWKVELLNSQVDNIPMGDYNLEIDLTDPQGPGQTAIYLMKFGTVPTNIWNYKLQNGTTSGGGEVYREGVLIQVNQTNNPNNGFYIYTKSQPGATNGVNFEQWVLDYNATGITTPALIDRKNAITSAGIGTCPSWMYASTKQAVLDIWKGNCGMPGSNPPVPEEVNQISNTEIAEYYYQVLEA